MEKFLFAIREGARLISLGRKFHVKGVTTEKALTLVPTKCIFVSNELKSRS